MPRGCPVTDDATRHNQAVYDQIAVLYAQQPARRTARRRPAADPAAGPRSWPGCHVAGGGDAAGQVRPLLPASPGCLALVTSRSQLTSLVAAEGAQPLNLDVLSEDEARDLLANRLDPRRLEDERPAANELIRQCARLPLALVIAAARAAARPGFSLGELAAELRGARSPLDALGTGDPPSAGFTRRLRISLQPEPRPALGLSGQRAARGAGCWPKKRVNSALALGPRGSV